MEKPDIVTLLGDNLTESTKSIESIDYFYSQINEAIENTTLTMAIGNHDIENNNQMLYYTSAQKYKNILLQLDYDEIGANYIVLIHLHDQPILALVHLYTHIDKCRGMGQQGCPSQGIINDLNITLKDIKEKYDVQILIVTHIPSKDVASLVMANDQYLYGILGTKLSCPDNFSIIDEIDYVDYVIHAHDHDNDFFGYYQKNNKGYWILYSRIVGYDSKSMAIHKRGARLFEFSSIGKDINYNNYNIEEYKNYRVKNTLKKKMNTNSGLINKTNYLGMVYINKLQYYVTTWIVEKVSKLKENYERSKQLILEKKDLRKLVKHCGLINTETL